MKIIKLILPIVFVAFFLSANVFADSENTQVREAVSNNSVQNKKIGEKNPNDNNPESSRSQVFKDPETGEFLTREEALDRGIIQNEDSFIFEPQGVEQEIIIEPLEHGGFQAELPATYNHTMGLSVDDNGKLKSTCNHE